jgi:hypothetical protein
MKRKDCAEVKWESWRYGREQSEQMTRREELVSTDKKEKIVK